MRRVLEILLIMFLIGGALPGVLAVIYGLLIIAFPSHPSVAYGYACGVIAVAVVGCIVWFFRGVDTVVRGS
jgi:hypothetical protein